MSKQVGSREWGYFAAFVDFFGECKYYYHSRFQGAKSLTTGLQNSQKFNNQSSCGSLSKFQNTNDRKLWIPTDLFKAL